MKKHILILVKNDEQSRTKSMKFDVNGVAVARHGLILSQDGAMHSRMVFVPGPKKHKI